MDGARVMLLWLSAADCNILTAFSSNVVLFIILMGMFEMKYQKNHLCMYTVKEKFLTMLKYSLDANIFP